MGSDADEDLRFKEFELARRVGLESISSHQSTDSAQLQSTHQQLGIDSKNHYVSLRKMPPIEDKTAAEPATKVVTKLSRNTTLGRFSRSHYGSLIDQKAVDTAVSKRVQSIDVASDVPLWFEKICELDGVTDAETLIVQNEVMQNETQLMRMWSQEAQGLVTIKAEESELRDISELEELQNRNDELEKEGIVTLLGVEALASVMNPHERRQMINRNKGSRIRGERELLQILGAKRRAIVYGYFRRSKLRENELQTTFAEGPTMLARFGELLESTCNNMTQNNKGKLLEELHRNGIEVGRLKANDATNKMHRKILFNALDKSEGIMLKHGDMTAVRLPSKRATWGYAFATDGPWRVRRYDKEMVRATTRAALAEIAMEHATSVDTLRNLAKVLDAVQVSAHSRLHQQIIDSPHRARELVQARLTALGLSFVLPNTTSLVRIRNDVDLKRAVKQVINKIDARLEFHGRFYLEAHFHRVGTEDLPMDEELGAIDDAEEEAISPRTEPPQGPRELPTTAGVPVSEAQAPAIDVANAQSGETEPESKLPEPGESDEPSETSGQPASCISVSEASVTDDSESQGSASDFRPPGMRPNAYDEEVLNDYQEPEHELWMVGASFQTTACVGFPGNDAHSFGIRSDGTIWHDGVPRQMCADLSDEVVIGMLLDLNVGSISLYAGGVCVGVAFGVDATCFSPEEQRRQGELIREQHLIPGFAMRGAAHSDIGVGGADGGNSVTIGPDDLDRLDRASTSGRRDSDDDVDDENGAASIGGADGGENEDAASSRLDSPSSTVPEEAAQSKRGPQSSEAESSINRDSAEKTGEADEDDLASGGGLGGLGDRDEFLMNMDGDPTAFVPALTVNFGGYSFSRLPPQSLSCDAYLSFATEAKENEDKERFAREFRRQMQRNNNQGQEQGGGPASDGDGDGEGRQAEKSGSGGGGGGGGGASAVAASFQEEIDESELFLDEDDKMVVNEGLLGSKGVVLEYRSRVDFFNKMKYPQPRSWSSFPPHAQRLGFSANVLQRAGRRFLGRKWRQREMLTQTLAITMLQRKLKRVLPRWRYKKNRAATMVQKVWRGRVARRQVQMAMQFAHRPEMLESAATKVQAQFRRVRAGEHARKEAAKIEADVNLIIASAHRIQNRWRNHKHHESVKQAAFTASCVRQIQRIWRGRKARQKIEEELGEEESERLRSLGISIVRQTAETQAVGRIQRIWRGRADRAYAEMRRMAYNSSAIVLQHAWKSYRIKCHVHVLCDTGTADAVIKFMRCVKAIY